MSINNFDDILKNKLGQIDVDYDDKSWDAFEQKLDKALAEDGDDAFDEQIRSKIEEQAPISYNEEHWFELSDKIDYENALTNKIYTYKLVELVILFLIVYSFFQISPIDKSQNRSVITAYNEVFKRVVDEEVIAKVEEQQLKLSSEVVAVSTVGFQRGILKDSRTPISLGSLKNAKEDILLGLSAYEVKWDENSTKASRLASMDVLTMDSKLYAIDMLEQKNETNTVVAINTLDRLGLSTLDSKGKDYALAMVNNQNKTQKWISYGINADINIVNTPIEYLFNDKDRLLGVMGTSGQIGYGIKTGNNEFEFGLGYSYKSYDPSLREVYGVDNVGVYESNLDRIEFHVAQLSATYKKYFVQNRKWSAYAAIGAVHNFILYSEYDISSDLRSGIVSPRSSIKESSKLLTRNYYTGLLQNTSNSKDEKRIAQSDFRTEGDLFDNTFITSFLGLGVQRNFGHDKAVFFQHSYQRQLFSNKLGPNNDQINSFSFTLGAKFKI